MKIDCIFDLCVPEPNSGCWLWSGDVNGGGYARVEPFRHRNGQREAWRAAFGDPGDAHVLHRCDMRCCLNPDHLFLGSNADNVADKVAKSRQARSQGEQHPAAVLTDAQVMEIYHDARPLSAIAAALGVTKATVNDIRSGKHWAHLTGGVPQRRLKPMGVLQGTAKVNDEIVRRIRADARSQSAIAADLGLSQSTISRIRSREIWPHVH